VKTVLLALIRAYQYLLRPWWGRQCRFSPSCSDYALEAIARHGAIRGSIFSARRIACCHPWHAGGFDPVP
jgi:putative membrane protein insertion efficiency factor